MGMGLMALLVQAERGVVVHGAVTAEVLARGWFRLGMSRGDRNEWGKLPRVGWPSAA
jgi:hypothetical protein